MSGIYLYEPLQYFFQNAKLNIYQGSIAINLINLFPLLKQGYETTNSTHEKIISLYTKVNNLRDPNDDKFIIPDDLINQAFGGTISAQFFGSATVEKIAMKIAVETGLVPISFNTYQLISQTVPSSIFTPERFHYDIFQILAFFNSESIGLDREIVDEVDIEGSIAAIIYIVIFHMKQELKSDRVQFENFIEAITNLQSKFFTSEDEDQNTEIHRMLEAKSQKIFDRNKQLLISRLIEDPWLKLLYAIIVNDSKGIIQSQIDPRINNNEAYKLARKLGNREIIATLESKIAQRKVLTDEVISTYLGQTAVTRDIFDTRF